MPKHSFDRAGALRDVEAALKCPVEWWQVLQMDRYSWFSPLEQLWASTVERFAVDNEARYVGDEVSLEGLSDDRLQSMQINIRTWLASAQAEYRGMTRRFWALRFAGRQEYSKHLPPLGAGGDPKLIEISTKKDGISRFYQTIPDDVMLSTFFEGIFWQFGYDGIGLDETSSLRDEGLWTRILRDENCRIAFQTVGHIGASNGFPTNFLCFELNASTPILHAYPIPEDEAKQINSGHSIVCTDRLEGWCIFF